MKPCPFCGNQKPKLVNFSTRFVFGLGFRVECDFSECRSSGPHRQSKASAIAGWAQRFKHEKTFYKKEMPGQLIPVKKFIQNIPPQEPSIYFLIDQQEIVYIGSTLRPRQRLHNHRNSFKKFSSCAWIQVDKQSLRKIEAEMIRAIRPKLNRQSRRVAPTGKPLDEILLKGRP